MYQYIKIGNAIYKIWICVIIWSGLSMWLMWMMLHIDCFIQNRHYSSGLIIGLPLFYIEPSISSWVSLLIIKRTISLVIKRGGFAHKASRIRFLSNRLEITMITTFQLTILPLAPHQIINSKLMMMPICVLSAVANPASRSGNDSPPH